MLGAGNWVAVRRDALTLHFLHVVRRRGTLSDYVGIRLEWLLALVSVLLLLPLLANFFVWLKESIHTFLVLASGLEVLDVEQIVQGCLEIPACLL